MFQFLIGPSRVGRTIGTRSSTRRPPRTTPSVIVLPMRTSEISRLSTDTSPTLVPLAETMMSPGSRLAWRLKLPEQSPCGYEHELSHARSPGRPEMYCRRRRAELSRVGTNSTNGSGTSTASTGRLENALEPFTTGSWQFATSSEAASPSQRAACAGRRFAAMLLVAHQGATVSAGKAACT